MAAELFDTHCHLNLAEHFPNPDAEIVRARDAGVTRLCLVGIDEPTCGRAIQIAERHEGVFAIVGCHPNSAAGFDDGFLSWIGTMLEHPKVVALGEIGLDYHWDFATPEQQKTALTAQLDLARDRMTPVVIHCREAYGDLLRLLEDRPPHAYLFHCFSGDEADAARVDKLGGYIGVDGPITYKKSAAYRELIGKWPRERLLLETDSPYLTPEPYRGKPNHPAYLPFVNAAVAAAWQCDVQESARQTTANALQFFRLA